MVTWLYHSQGSDWSSTIPKSPISQKLLQRSVETTQYSTQYGGSKGLRKGTTRASSSTTSGSKRCIRVYLAYNE